MPTFDDVLKSAKKYQGTKQDVLDSWPAYLGNGEGVVNGPQANFSYVRYPLLSSPAIEIYNIRCSAGYDGMRVRVGYLAEQSKLLQVLTQDDPRFAWWGATGDGSGGSSGVFIGQHAQQHSYLSTDPTYHDFYQVTTLGVYTVSGFIVQIRHGNIPRSGVDTEVVTQTLDLTSHVPGSGALFALISINSSGAVVVTDGASVASFSDLDISDIPDTPVGNFRLAAVALYQGQAAIVQNRSEQDIWDLRWPQENLAGETLLATDIIKVQVFGG